MVRPPVASGEDPEVPGEEEKEAGEDRKDFGQEEREGPGHRRVHRQRGGLQRFGCNGGRSSAKDQIEVPKWETHQAHQDRRQEESPQAVHRSGHRA